MRGRPDAACKDAVHPRDSSPPTRGRQSMGGFLWGLPRFIPSYEGQTSLLRQSVIKRVIHPLLQGADFPKRFSASFPADSSPSERGRLVYEIAAAEPVGFIPSCEWQTNPFWCLVVITGFIHSCEGQTFFFCIPAKSPTVHPLLRRADVVNGVHTYIGYDSSPLTRGRPGVLMYRV